MCAQNAFDCLFLCLFICFSFVAWSVRNAFVYKLPSPPHTHMLSTTQTLPMPRRRYNASARALQKQTGCVGSVLLLLRSLGKWKQQQAIVWFVLALRYVFHAVLIKQRCTTRSIVYIAADTMVISLEVGVRRLHGDEEAGSRKNSYHLQQSHSVQRRAACVCIFIFNVYVMFACVSIFVSPAIPLKLIGKLILRTNTSFRWWELEKKVLLLRYACACVCPMLYCRKREAVFYTIIVTSV